MVVAVTNLRAPHEGALFAGFQSAKGSAVSDFTASDTWRLWTDFVSLDVGPEPVGEAWQDIELGPPAAGAVIGRQSPTAIAEIKLTAASAEALLRSNFGAFAGGSFTLATQIASTRWLTLAWVEDRHLGTTSSKRIVRVSDAWCHRLSINAPEHPGIVTVRAEFAGRAVTEEVLSSSGVTLPTAPMRPADDVVATTSGITVTRAPAGSAVAQRVYGMRLGLSQGLAHEWDQSAFSYDVWKTGKLRAELELDVPHADESAAFLTRALAGNTDRYQVAVTVGSSTLTLDLYEVLLRVDPFGQAGRAQPTIRVRGFARVDSSSNFVSITLS